MNPHGVVIGGGIGGLLAAHAIAARFERVTVLERYRYPADSISSSISTGPAARRGVPQSRCLHLLMAAGAAAFDELMPGWRGEAIARGAIPFDASADAAIHFSQGWLPRTPSGIKTFACSRDLLETVLRRGLDDRHVEVREGQHVVALVGTRRRVTGVCTVGGDDQAEASIEADLVVDASGRRSLLPNWIEGLPRRSGSTVEETVVDGGTQYVSRWFRLDSTYAPDWHCLSIAPTRDTHFRAAMMLRAEDDRWGVVLLAPAGDTLPSDDDAFLAFTDGLAEGRLRAALDRAEPADAIQHYGRAGNRLRHYDRLVDWPSGIVALGDSVCALDPYFGLGMTVAARGAVLLREYLDHQDSGTVSGRAFQRQLAATHVQPWRLATGCDTDGRPLAREENYLERLYGTAPGNPDVAKALLAVQHLLRPVETLFEFCRT
jgi:2-polyprenyl-6-methoxyphenol hydroxylase-like FAD-dependent oxidoreductase